MNETCGNCGKYDVSVRRVTRSFGAGTNLLVIEELPLLSCLATMEWASSAALSSTNSRKVSAEGASGTAAVIGAGSAMRRRIRSHAGQARLNRDASVGTPGWTTETR